MPDRPSDFIDYDDEPAPPPKDIEGDDESDPLPRADVDAGFGDDEDDNAGNIADGIGRAAAVLKFIVERIVDEPDRIAIAAAQDERGPVLLLRVGDEDRGKVIGRQGRIVHAIRTIVKAASVGAGEKVNVEILD
jgi:predicted RNA-binding protein YlqC (UPF0109 family)